MKFKYYGKGQTVLKMDVVPHKFDCQRDRLNITTKTKRSGNCVWRNKMAANIDDGDIDDDTNGTVENDQGLVLKEPSDSFEEQVSVKIEPSQESLFAEQVSEQSSEQVSVMEKNPSKVPKTSAERARDYRARIRANRPPKKPPKSRLERNREWRERKKKKRLQMEKNGESSIEEDFADEIPLEIVEHSIKKEETDSEDYEHVTSEIPVYVIVEPVEKDGSANLSTQIVEESNKREDSDSESFEQAHTIEIPIVEAAVEPAEKSSNEDSSSQFERGSENGEVILDNLSSEVVPITWVGVDGRLRTYQTEGGINKVTPIRLEKKETEYCNMNEVIIDQVKNNYPHLYDTRHPKYRDKFLRKKTWEKIGALINVEGRVVQSRWKSLRDRYVKERKIQSSGKADTSKKQWEFLPLLGFLNDSIEVGATSSKLPLNTYPNCGQSRRDTSTTAANPSSSLILSHPPSPMTSSTSSPIQTSTLSYIISPIPTTSPALMTTTLLSSPVPSTPSAAVRSHETAPIPSTSENSTVNRRKALKRKDEDDLLYALLANQPKAMDEDDYYCMSLAKRMRNLDVRRKAKARLAIEKLFMELEFPEEMEGDLSEKNGMKCERKIGVKRFESDGKDRHFMNGTGGKSVSVINKQQKKHQDIEISLKKKGISEIAVRRGKRRKKKNL